MATSDIAEIVEFEEHQKQLLEDIHSKKLELKESLRDFLRAKPTDHYVSEKWPLETHKTFKLDDLVRYRTALFEYMTEILDPVIQREQKSEATARKLSKRFAEERKRAAEALYAEAAPHFRTEAKKQKK